MVCCVLEAVSNFIFSMRSSTSLLNWCFLSCVGSSVNYKSFECENCIYVQNMYPGKYGDSLIPRYIMIIPEMNVLFNNKTSIMLTK